MSTFIGNFLHVIVFSLASVISYIRGEYDVMVIPVCAISILVCVRYAAKLREKMMDLEQASKEGSFGEI